ncbi:protein shisa-5-like isoform X1 [Vespa mandarinia]|uniref:protein shisa-5-like isoform X1 n=1 Tax=Vespa mandarinia TaxID=7446 RepID=UPI00161BBFDC|nr:protein shisa-5-like isoform X1 [Vespa mandarinia]XP_046828226.1 protein shisa-5-like isoform X1 [Vespa crabro]
MSYAIVLLTISCLCTGFAVGMECTYKDSKNLFEKMMTSCPVLWDSSKSYCCYDLANENYYCCTQEEFAMTMGLGIIVPVVIAAGIIVSLIVCCISCLYCSCCPWYRRRHQGTVYGKVQTPSVVHVIQTSTNPPSDYANQTEQNHYTPYPTNVGGMPQPPPAYTIEPYGRQAPYNPGYVQ